MHFNRVYAFYGFYAFYVSLCICIGFYALFIGFMRFIGFYAFLPKSKNLTDHFAVGFVWLCFKTF